MQETAEFLFSIGGLLLLGLGTDYLGRYTSLPRVTLLLIFGFIVGNHGLQLIPDNVINRFEIITDIALLMIGFLLGGKLTFKSLKKAGKHILWISMSTALVTAVIVGSLLMSIGVPLEIAILLGCISAATAPAATTDTILESGNKNRFSRMLMAIVAIDDAWALILFSMGLALISILSGEQNAALPLFKAAYEIGGAILLGGLIGLPATYLTGRLKSGKPMLTEALGLVLISGGAAMLLGVSFLITSMIMGAVIANFAKHHTYPFHEIENIEWPFMAIFFTLAGASLEIEMLTELGLVGVVYLVARAAGKIIGAWVGARISGADKEVRNWMGIALMPQAGVAIGMALLTANQFPQYRQTILSIVISSTIVFELIGPILTRLALKRTRHSRAKKTQ